MLCKCLSLVLCKIIGLCRGWFSLSSFRGLTNMLFVFLVSQSLLAAWDLYNYITHNTLFWKREYVITWLSICFFFCWTNYIFVLITEQWKCCCSCRILVANAFLVASGVIFLVAFGNYQSSGMACSCN